MPDGRNEPTFSPLRFGGLDAGRLEGLNGFINTALANDLTAAMANNGEALNAREAAALQRLTTDELRTLASLREKIQSAAYRGMDPSTAGWICGALC